jgi:hypothetical protein
MRTKIQFAVVALALSFALALPSNNSLHAQQALAEVSVESKTIAPNSTSSVNISLSNGPDAGVAAIRGSLRFDPKVLKATKVEGQQDYEVFASKLDNNAGEVGFVVVKLRAPYAKAGPLIKIEFQAIGKSGDKSDLKLFLSEFRDPDDRNIPNKIINGLITLGAVQNQPPTANFSFTPAEPKVDEEISFKDESTDPDGATDIVSWEWDFGDGTTSTDQNPKKKYSQKKVYDVRLTVRDRGGLTNFVIKKVPVGIVPPKADFRSQAHRAGQRRRREHRREDYYSEALEPARRGGLPQSARESATFTFTLPAGATSGTLFVFSISGKLVLKQEKLTGTQFVWDIKKSDVPSGPYYYLLIAFKENAVVGRSRVEKLVIQR